MGSSRRESSAPLARLAGNKNLVTEVGSIIVFALSVFALIALITFYANDPSFWSNAQGPAQNACGRIGSFLASLLLQWFGMGAFLVPPAVFFMAVAIHKKEGSARVIGTIGGMTVAVMSLTVFLTLQWKYWPYAGTMLLTGGAFGAWVASILVRSLNSVGSSIVALVVCCLAIVLSTPVSVAHLGARVFGFIGNWAYRMGRMVGTYLLFLAGLLAMRMAHAFGDFLQGLFEAAARRAKQRASGLNRELSRATKQVEATVVDGKSTRKTKTALPRLPGDEGEEEEADDEGEELSAAAGTAKPVKAARIPKIGPESDDENDESLEASDGPVIEEGIGAKAVKKAAKAAKAVQDLGAGLFSEAPNVLDAEDGEEPALQSGSAAKAASGSAVKADHSKKNLPTLPAPSNGPEILPPEAQALTLAMNGGPAPAPGSAAADAASKAAARIAKVAARNAKRGSWQLPSIEFLRKPQKSENAIDRDKLIANSVTLKQKFADFGIDGEVTAVRPGPVITLYEFKPGPGVKVSRIASLADDLSMALSAQSVRILAPLPGKSVVGIEIPSDHRETVYMREFMEHPDFMSNKHMIPVAMGKDIGGQTVLSDLGRMPHLLCAGQTGSGKSVFMNGLICSLFFRYTPDELRMILVDPKFIEFRGYADMPHLLLPVVDDPKNAATALRWAVQEMERRYRILAKMGARNLTSFNQKVDEMGAEVVRDLLMAEENPDDDGASSASQSKTGSDWIEAFEPDETGIPRVGKLPYIVIIIDELADLMMIAKKEVEISIARIAQKARAAGIHLVIATQRPSTDVITGLIKANLPSRVSFSLASYIDSRTILDRPGAERLLGQGDMLFIPPGVSQAVRLHGAYLTDDEINKIVSFCKAQGKPSYREEILLAGDEDEEGGGEGDEEMDSLFHEAVEIAKRSGQVSASSLQRHLKVGYNRAARMIETMEARGIVGPADGARPREVLVR